MIDGSMTPVHIHFASTRVPVREENGVEIFRIFRENIKTKQKYKNKAKI
jgi:hypothetical protein